MQVLFQIQTYNPLFFKGNKVYRGLNFDLAAEFLFEILKKVVNDSISELNEKSIYEYSNYNVLLVCCLFYMFSEKPDGLSVINELNIDQETSKRLENMDDLDLKVQLMKMLEELVKRYNKRFGVCNGDCENCDKCDDSKEK